MGVFARLTQADPPRSRPIVLMSAILLLHLAGCSQQIVQARGEARFVVLATVDTLRADHLGAYGYPRPTSPFMDRVAAEGVVFDRAFASMTTTVPSHVSMLTSLYPIQHGVLANGMVLDDAALTLAELFDRAGFRTAAFVSTKSHFEPSNVDQGFEVFDQPGKEEPNERPGMSTVDRAIDWLTTVGADDRVFLWVHLFDPHTPYRAETRLGVSSPGEFRTFLAFQVSAHHADLGHYGGDEERFVTDIDSYDGEIRAADAALERLFEACRAEGLNQKSAWVVTADHGEGLGNHGWALHGKNLYNEALRVPLIVYEPGARRTAVRVQSVVEHVDLAPTLLELAGLEKPRTRMAWQGRSLVPEIRGSGGGEPKLAFAQRRAYRPRREPSREELALGYEPGERFSIQDDRFKYISWSEGPSELYDMVADPYETTDLSGTGLPEERKYRLFLARRIRDLRSRSRLEGQSVGQASLERLRTLGYIQ